MIDFKQLSNILESDYGNDCVIIRTHIIETKKIYPSKDGKPKIYTSTYSFIEGVNQGKQGKKKKEDKNVETKNKGEVDVFG